MTRFCARSISRLLDHARPGSSTTRAAQFDSNGQLGPHVSQPAGLPHPSGACASGTIARALCLLPALLMMLSAADPRAQSANLLPKALPTPLPYDIVYVRGPRFGD